MKTKTAEIILMLVVLLLVTSAQLWSHLPFPPGKNAVFPSGSSYYDYPRDSHPM
jgi:hypothetical protein